MYLKQNHNYVMMYMSRLQRSLMAQLRCRILPLKIETGGFQNVKDTNTGQYRKLKVSERVCDICKNDRVENEIHFVCNCESYRLLREHMYDEVIYKYIGLRQLSDANKLIYLMQYESKLLAKYVEEAWNIRKSILFI